jgi:hypothetical protein
MKCKKVRVHIQYVNQRVYNLKYGILNDALRGELSKHKIFLFKKYNRRLRWLKM